MKNLYCFILLCCSLFWGTAYTQVGIGTTDPKAQLDIRSTTQATPSNTDGMLIPKIDEFPLTNPTVDQDGMMVYVTGVGTPSKGFYYWDNTLISWTSVSGSGGGAEKINDLSDGKSDANGSSVFLGVDAGANDDGTDNFNVGLGFEALVDNTSGSFNTALGYRALYLNDTGFANTATGYGALRNNNGNYNIAMGHLALFENLTGTNNTAFGYRAGFSVLGNGGIYLGSEAGRNETGSNKLYIENSNADANNALIYGEFDTNMLRVNGRLELPFATDASPITGSGTLEIGNGLRLDSNEIITNTNLPLHLQADNDGKLQVGFTDFAVDTEFGRTGVGTATPLAKLDIRSSNQATPANTDGILIPKANNFPTTNPGAAQDGMFLFVTGSGTPAKGLYYWDNSATAWIAATGAKKIDDLSDGKSDSDGTDDGASLFLGVDAGANDDGTNNSNVGVGYQVLMSSTTGFYNTAIGREALKDNTTGFFNTAIGTETLKDNTTGSNNTAIGTVSLANNTTGVYNTASGSYSLVFNTTGTQNTTSGSYSLRGNTTGSSNTTLGYSSFYTNTTGNNNTAIGFAAGRLSTGSGNVFLGASSGFNEIGNNKLYIENSSANPNNALIYGEFDTNILRTNGELQIGNPTGTGYALPTVDGTATQILATDGNGQLVFVAASGAEKLDDLSDGKSDNDGSQNGSSVYLGIAAGQNDDSSDNRNVGVGYNALQQITTGASNTATGYNTLAVNTGSYNNAFGTYALQLNTTGHSNTAIGMNSMTNNATGLENTAVGVNSLRLKTGGDYNTALGNQTLYNNTTGATNTSIGDRAGFSNVSGSGNIFLGNRAGYSETGSNKLYIENSNANANNALVYGEFNTNLLRVNGTLEVVGDIEYTGTITDVSDRRLKENFKPITNVLPKLEKVIGYTYNMKDGATKKREFGVIAQDVQKVFPEMVRTIDNKGHLGVSYIQLTPILLEAIKEQQTLIESLQKENVTLKEQANAGNLKSKELEARLQKLEAVFLKEVTIKD